MYRGSSFGISSFVVRSWQNSSAILGPGVGNPRGLDARWGLIYASYNITIFICSRELEVLEGGPEDFRGEPFSKVPFNSSFLETISASAVLVSKNLISREDLEDPIPILAASPQFKNF